FPALVEQRRQALARRQLPLVVLAPDLVRAASLLEAGAELAILRREGVEPAHRWEGERRGPWQGLRPDMLGRPCFDVRDQLGRRPARSEQLADPRPPERLQFF